jgi:hypothetical protein
MGRHPKTFTAADSAFAAKTASLFDHLVGGGKQRGWHVEAKRLGGLEIDDEPVSRGLLKWQFPRFLAPENTVDVTSRLPKPYRDIRTVGD